MPGIPLRRAGRGAAPFVRRNILDRHGGASDIAAAHALGSLYVKVTMPR